MNANNHVEEKTQKKKGKKELLLLIIVFVVIVIVALVFYGKKQETGSYAIVTVNGEEYGRYSLDKDQTVSIEVDGVETNVLVIANGQADMTQANCPDLLCVNMKAISNHGETIVCLPNKVVVEIESDTSHSELDAMAQ